MESVTLTSYRLHCKLLKKRKKMANDNHLFPVTCYHVTMTKNNSYYNEFFEIGQQKINFSLYELGLPSDDPVYTLKK